MEANDTKRLAELKIQFMRDAIAKGLTVYLQTHMRTTKIQAKHLAQVKATDSGLYVQHGNKWLCHNASKLSAQ